MKVIQTQLKYLARNWAWWAPYSLCPSNFNNYNGTDNYPLIKHFTTYYANCLFGPVASGCRFKVPEDRIDTGFLEWSIHSFVISDTIDKVYCIKQVYLVTPESLKFGTSGLQMLFPHKYESAYDLPERFLINILVHFQELHPKKEMERIETTGGRRRIQI